jgi:rhodanese-related sulfurtransferase
MQASPADLPLEIDVHSVKAMIDTGDDFLLLDCRDVDEHQFVRIAGSVLIPVGELAGRLAELDEHRERHIVVHCHYGGRSLEATRILRAKGFQAQNMAGGIDAWSVAVDPRLPRY